MHSLRTITAILTILLATSALAQCPDLIELDCVGGTAWFGLRHDDAVIGQGQTVTLPCDAAVLEVEFHFVITGNPNGGVPSMVAGDEIHVTMIDGDGLHYMTATNTVPTDIFNGWIAFDFAEDMVVPAGNYLFAAYTTVPRWGSMVFCPGEDLYPDGERMSSASGLEGPWWPFGDGHDIPFRLHTNPDLVAASAETWTAVKGLFQ